MDEYVLESISADKASVTNTFCFYLYFISKYANEVIFGNFVYP